MHKYLRINKYTKSAITEVAVPKTELQFPDNDKQNLPIVQSDFTNVKFDGYGFRNWYYVIAKVKLTKKGSLNEVCLDSGYTITLINREFLRTYFLDSEIRKMVYVLKIRGIGLNVHAINE